MKLAVSAFILSLLPVVIGCGVSNKTTSAADTHKTLKRDNYKLVWADEFDKDGPVDATNWSFEKGFVRNQEH